MIVGITGSIATGKTFVTDYLKTKGYNLIDADVLAKDVLNFGEKGYYEAIEYFSESILDDKKNIDRKKLAKIIFNDDDKKKVLENIVHPQVIKKIQEFISNIKKSEIAFVSIPLLFEIHFEKYLDKIVVVFSKKDIQIKRLMERDNIDLEYAEKKINSQLSQEQKVKLADYVIDNSFTKEETINSINEVVEKIRSNNGI